MNQSRVITYTSVVTRTLWRIENELANAPSLNDLARAEGVSPFHLSRAFSLVVGQPVMAYVRARRLTEAALKLHNDDDSVLNIALDAGYESPEGFARAFRDVFGVSPKAARGALPQSLQEPIIMETKQINLPEPEMKTFEGRALIGRSGRYTMETRAKIPALWERTASEVGPRMFGNETYGVSYNFDADSFDYFVGFEDDGLGDDLDRLVLPAGPHAVFQHEGHISTIAETWAAIFDQWAQEAKVELASGPEFELYAKDFDVAKPGGVSIWIPVKE